MGRGYNVHLKCRSGFRAQAMGGNWKVSEYVSKSLKNSKETVSRKHMDTEEAASKGLQKSEVNATGNWRKGDSCYV